MKKKLLRVWMKAKSGKYSHYVRQFIYYFRDFDKKIRKQIHPDTYMHLLHIQTHTNNREKQTHKHTHESPYRNKPPHATDSHKPPNTNSPLSTQTHNYTHTLNDTHTPAGQETEHRRGRRCASWPCPLRCLVERSPLHLPSRGNSSPTVCGEPGAKASYAFSFAFSSLSILKTVYS